MKLFGFQNPDVNPSDLEHQSYIIKNNNKGESDIYRAREAKDHLINYFNYIYEDENGEKKILKSQTTLETFYSGKKISGDKNAFLGRRIKDRFVWLSYEQVEENFRNLGSAFVNLYGIEPRSIYNKTVGIFMINTPEWMITDFACQAYSIVSTPLYDTFDNASILYIIENSNTKVVVCLERSLEKLLTICKGTKMVEHIIVCDFNIDTVPENYKRQAEEQGISIRTLEEVYKYGKEHTHEYVPCQPTDAYTICYTSGTTGTPKGVVIPNEGIISSIAGFYSRVNYMINKDYIHLSYLPLAHVFERTLCFALIAVGAKIGYFSGSVKHLMSDIALLKPSIIPAVPRVLCRIYDSIMNTIKSSNYLKRLIFNFALGRKKNILKKGINTRNSIWDRLVFAKIQEVLGNNMKLIICGAAPIDYKVIDFMRVVLGCQIVEGYGQTETCSCSNIQMYGDYQYKYGSNVGPPTSNNELKLVDVPEMDYYSTDQPNPRGELCVRGYNTMIEYNNNPEITNETIIDGWLHSGDIAEILPNGTFKIIDRKKNIFKLSQGEYISPEKVEIIINNSKYVTQSFVEGNSLSARLIAIIIPDFEAVMNESFENKEYITNIEELCKSQAVHDMILKDIKEISRKFKLNGFEIPCEIILSPEQFSVENNMLTPTFKIKRVQIRRYYSKEIESMYLKIDQTKK